MKSRFLNDVSFSVWGWQESEKERLLERGQHLEARNL